MHGLIIFTDNNCYKNIWNDRELETRQTESIMRLSVFYEHFEAFLANIGPKKNKHSCLFYEKGEVQSSFWQQYYFYWAHIRPLEIILAKKTTELVLFFHKNTIKKVLFWSNMGQKTSKC